ncbi:hypothetical protein ACFQE4_15275 [Streptomyces thermocoprophilus]|uniref:Uncharacterized protein n=1 Tax=Streptomyces thermocoprophilus TaxID=78356 RepID=A0ABV5VKI1_9ACTN
MFRDGSPVALRTAPGAFEKLGATGEDIERFRRVALTLPDDADLGRIRKLLSHGVEKQWWDMEEGCVTAPGGRPSRADGPRRAHVGPAGVFDPAEPPFE